MNTFVLPLLFLLSLLINESYSATVVKPKAVVLKVMKDQSTGLYTTMINQRTPLVPVKFAVDLTGHSLWAYCDRGYKSSTFRSVNCKSASCALAKPVGRGCGNSCAVTKPTPWYCNKNACFTSPANPFSNIIARGEAAEDVFSFPTPAAGKPAVAQKFVFTCAKKGSLGALPTGVTGVAGLGLRNVALTTQLANTFKFSRKFQMCLSPSTKSNGIIVFGDLEIPNDSPFTIFTPMKQNNYSISTNYEGPRDLTDYYVEVTSVKVNGRDVPVNDTLLSFYGNRGAGGTKFSTADPYTVLKTPVYTAMIEAFVKELPPSVKRVSPVKRLGACFSGVTAATPLPSIDFVLGNAVDWRVFNSTASQMVQAKTGVYCLGFVEDRGDAGYGPDGPTIQIGPHQIADHMLEFDFSRLSISIRTTKCDKIKV